MSAEAFVAGVLKGFAEAFQPLADAVKSPDPQAATDLLAQLGRLTPAGEAKKRLSSIEPALTKVTSIIPTLERVSSGQADALEILEAISDAGDAIKEFIASLDKLKSDFAGWKWDEFPDEILGLLIYDYLASHKPGLLGVLRALNIISEEDIEGDIDIDAIGEDTDLPPEGVWLIPYGRRIIHWGRIAALANPQTFLGEAFGWGGVFQYEQFIGGLEALFANLGFPSGLYPAPDEHLNLHNLKERPFYAPDSQIRSGILELRVPLYWSIAASDPETVTFRLVIMPVPADDTSDPKTATPSGVAVFPELRGSLKAVEVQLAEGMTLSIRGQFQSALVLAALRPKPEETYVVPSAPQGNVDASLELAMQPLAPWILLGSRDGTRLELAKARVSISAGGPFTGKHDDIDYKIEFRIEEARLVLDLSDADGFLQKVLPSGQHELAFAVGLSWSKKSGFQFSGSAKLEVIIPVHKTFANIITVETVNLSLGADGRGGIMLGAGLSGGFQLGPIAASVDRVGLRAQLREVIDGTGNLGRADMGFGFQPPSGVGLELSLGPVTGGGYLFHDPEQGQYAGILQLSLPGGLAVKAIGLLNTRLPDGRKGFSLLIIITAEFPPIQLGFGFTLNGLGGLAGINRRVDVEAARAGLRDRSLNSILFPQDPIRHAPQIIANLAKVFPPTEGKFIFGPMLMIGWGTPPIITLSVAVLIQLPLPIRAVILAQLKVLLPDQRLGEELAYVRLKMDAIGILDFGSKELSLDATIYDSRVMGFSLTGDMALRLNWGNEPVFMLSVGGFHPRFQTPANFPRLNRLAVGIGDGKHVRMRLDAYFALTSNTLQVGAKFELHASGGGFHLKGHLSFDALFYTDPFRFVADISAGVHLDWEGIGLGIQLDFTLSGPGPWRAAGKATFHIWKFKKSLSFDKTFGPAPALPPPPNVDVLQLLMDALSEQNWSTQLPEGSQMLVTLRDLPADAKVRLLHPRGRLAIHQKVVPLGVAIEKFDNVLLAVRNGKGALQNRHVYQIDIVVDNKSSDDEKFRAVERTDDYFAPGQFFVMTDANKIGSPSFKRFPAGYDYSTLSNIGASSPSSTRFLYEELKLDRYQGEYQPPPPKPPPPVPAPKEQIEHEVTRIKHERKRSDRKWQISLEKGDQKFVQYEPEEYVEELYSEY